MTSDPLDPAIEAKVRASFARQSLMTTIGAEMGALTKGSAQISVDVGEEFKQQQGVAHGGLIFSIADSAAGYAALTLMPFENDVMTAEVKINYLSAGVGRLLAEGRVLKAGRRLVIVTGDVWAINDGLRKHVAVLQGTMVPVAG